MCHSSLATKHSRLAMIWKAVNNANISPSKSITNWATDFLKFIDLDRKWRIFQQKHHTETKKITIDGLYLNPVLCVKWLSLHYLHICISCKLFHPVTSQYLPYIGNPIQMTTMAHTNQPVVILAAQIAVFLYIVYSPQTDINIWW